MLNLEDLTISELRAYYDGLKEVIEILNLNDTIPNRIALVKGRESEVKRLIRRRFDEMENDARC